MQRAIAAGSTTPPSALRTRMKASASRLVAGFDRDQLVAAHPGPPVGNVARAILVQLDGVFARIDDDEIVAEAVHS